MNVLFWVDVFPTISETFIRDQVVYLKKEGVNVFIYPKSGRANNTELDALIGFEKYKLSHDVCNIDEYFYESKLKRFLNALIILLISVFNGNFQLYLKSLSVKKFGKQASSLRLFFRTHFILKHNIDIIHAHFGPNGNDASILKSLGLPFKLFTTFHGYDIRLGITQGGDIYSNLFKLANGIISISEYNKFHLLKLGVPVHKIIDLPNGVNTDFFKPKEKSREDNCLKIITVARLVDEKALNIAINAVAYLFEQRPELDFKYTIVGEGPNKSKLQKLIDDLKLSDRVKLIGAKSSIEVKEFMQQSHLFLLSSKEEALPTVLLEAQSCGLLILATDVGDIRNMVKGGYVIEGSNKEKFKQALSDLVFSYDDIKMMAKEGRCFVKKNFCIKDLSKKLITYYKEY